MSSAPLRPRYRTTSNVLKLGNVESPNADGWQVHLGMCPEQQLDGATETGLRRTVTAQTSRRPDRAPGFRAMVPPFPREDRIHRDDAGASRGAGSLCEATLPACLCTHRPRPRGPHEGATGLVIVWYCLSFPRLFTDMQNFCCQEEVTEVILF